MWVGPWARNTLLLLLFFVQLFAYDSVHCSFFSSKELKEDVSGSGAAQTAGTGSRCVTSAHMFLHLTAHHNGSTCCHLYIVFEYSLEIILHAIIQVSIAIYLFCYPFTCLSHPSITTQPSFNYCCYMVCAMRCPITLSLLLFNIISQWKKI